MRPPPRRQSALPQASRHFLALASLIFSWIWFPVPSACFGQVGTSTDAVPKMTEHVVTPFAAFRSTDLTPTHSGSGASRPSDSDKTPRHPVDRVDEIEELRQRLTLLEKELARPVGPANSQQDVDDSSNSGRSASNAASPTGSGSTQKQRAEVEAGDKPLPAEQTKRTPSSAASSVSSPPSDKWEVKLGGHVQMDYVLWPAADPAIAGTQNYFNFRRLRLVADGAGYDQFDFRLQMTLEPGDNFNASTQASPDVKDAYISINEVPGLGRIRFGNFFVPFSLEQVTNDTNNIFTERSIPTQGIFAADREVGMAVYNHNFDQSLSWAGGVFFDSISDTIKTRFGDRQGYRISGRLNWVPLYSESDDKRMNGRYVIHTGIGVLHTDTNDERVRFRARPQIQRGPILIDTGFLEAPSDTIGGLELAFVMGAVTLQNEAFLSQVNLLNGQALHVGGAYSHLSYFLTGENRNYERFGQHGAQFGRNRPNRNLSLRRGCYGWGALEAKVRWSYLDLSDAGAGQYQDFSSGFNWYWSDRTRIMFDWIHPFTTADTVFGATSSDLLALRLDYNW